MNKNEADNWCLAPVLPVDDDEEPIADEAAVTVEEAIADEELITDNEVAAVDVWTTVIVAPIPGWFWHP